MRATGATLTSALAALGLRLADRVCQSARCIFLRKRPKVDLSLVSTGVARHSVAILGFKNLSGRPDTAWLSTALSEMLTTELGAGEKLLTISGENVARVKNDLALPETDSLAADTLARVRKNLGSDFVVLGSYLDLGDGSDIRVDLRVQDAKTGQMFRP